MIPTESADRLRRRWANLNPWFRALILLFPAGLVALGCLPVYRGLKVLQVERNMKNALVAASDNDLAQARDLSLTVLQSGDSRIEAFRILDRTMASLRDRRHVDIARSLLRHPEGSDTDRLEGFRGLSQSVALGLLGQAWVGLPENCKVNADFAVLFSDRLMDEGLIKQATLILLQVPEKNRNKDLEQLLIRILIRNGKTVGIEEAQNRIAKGWAVGGERDSWIGLLEEIPIPDLDAWHLDPVRKCLPDPVKGEPARLALLAARIDIAAGRIQAPKMNDAMVLRWRDEAPVELARFLQALNPDGGMAGVFDDDRIRRNPELIPLLVDSCERSGDWTGMGRILDAFPEGLPKSEWLAQRAMVFFKAGDPVQGSASWAAAMLEAKFAETCEPFFKLRRIAQAAGRGEEADQAFLEGILTGRGPLPLYSDLKALQGGLVAKARELILLRILSIYLPLEPTNIVLLSQCTYLGCLNGFVAPEDARKAMEPVARAFPEEKRIAFVLAAACLCQGNPAAAAAVLDPMQVNLQKITPGYRSVFVASMVLNGKLERGDPLVTDFPWKSLLPSELKKFREWTLPAAKDNAIK